MRGEYFTAFTHSGSCRELPPRARRIRLCCCSLFYHQGTTSACAENTGRTCAIDRGGRNYLRVRGEYSCNTTIILPHGELPPRARRIPQLRGCSRTCDGTTSACAENTPRGRRQSPFRWNYLRVRGEYRLRIRYRVCGLELPPRARRILNTEIGRINFGGTTSACAENT